MVPEAIPSMGTPTESISCQKGDKSMKETKYDICKETALTNKALDSLIILLGVNPDNTSPEDIERRLIELTGFYCPDLIGQQHQMEYDHE